MVMGSMLITQRSDKLCHTLPVITVYYYIHECINRLLHKRIVVMGNFDNVTIVGTDAIPFTRFKIVISKIDRELISLKGVCTRTWDSDLCDYIYRAYEVHDMHIYNAFYNILMLIHECERYAATVINVEMRQELFADIKKRRRVFDNYYLDSKSNGESAKLYIDGN